jgi:hypothetical protein
LPLAGAVTLSAAMADPVGYCAGFLFSLSFGLAKVVEIDNLGHASAPSVAFATACQARQMLQCGMKTIFQP